MAFNQQDEDKAKAAGIWDQHRIWSHPDWWKYANRGIDIPINSSQQRVVRGIKQWDDYIRVNEPNFWYERWNRANTRKNMRRLRAERKIKKLEKLNKNNRKITDYCNKK